MTAVDAGPAWSAWARVTPVVTASGRGARYVRVAIPLSIAPGADGSFRDLRVTDAHGVERPYALDPQQPGEHDCVVPPVDPGLSSQLGPRNVVAVTAPSAVADAVRHDQTWTFAPPAPVRAAVLTFADGGAFYERFVTVETSNDGAAWKPAGAGTIAHFADGPPQTSMCLTERTARYVRVTVHDANDAPLRSLRPALLVRSHTVVFPAGGTERLLSGNPRASAPTYDLAARLSHERWRAVDAATGMTVANDGYRDPRPLGERSPWLLTGTLLAAAAALAVTALRVLPPNAP
jgi:hypothetical protein